MATDAHACGRIVIAASLASSIVAFTLLLKATTALLGVPPQIWQVVSGVIVILLGVNLIVPSLWDRVSAGLGLQSRSNAVLSTSVSHGGFGGDILTGAALGPVFSSCSPTYALIVAAVLPVSFAEGLAYVIAYAIGLAGMLLLVALLGRGLVRRRGGCRPAGWFRRTIGVLFILVGLAVITGFDKQLADMDPRRRTLRPHRAPRRDPRHAMNVCLALPRGGHADAHQPGHPRSTPVLAVIPTSTGPWRSPRYNPAARAMSRRRAGSPERPCWVGHRDIPQERGIVYGV